MARFNKRQIEDRLIDARIAEADISKILNGLEKVVNAGYSSNDLDTVVNEIMGNSTFQKKFISNPLAVTEGLIIRKTPGL
jgi:hypothetical protein